MSKVETSPAYDLSSIGIQTHFVNEVNNLTDRDRSEGNVTGAFGGDKNYLRKSNKH